MSGDDRPVRACGVTTEHVPHLWFDQPSQHPYWQCGGVAAMRPCACGTEQAAAVALDTLRADRDHLDAELTAARAALELIAAPYRPEGPNLTRQGMQACARQALGDA